MICPKAKIFIDFHGDVIQQHQSDRAWDVNKFVMYLRQKQVPWREIFWKLYAKLEIFDCAECGQKFTGSEINHCSFHPMSPRFNFGHNAGVYPCCSAEALRFSTCGVKSGCTSKNHTLKGMSPNKRGSPSRR